MKSYCAVFTKFCLLSTTVGLVAVLRASEATDWAEVEALAKPLPLSYLEEYGKPDSQLKDPQVVQLENLRLASEKAHSFYGKFPASQYAATARKNEILYALQAIQLGASDLKQKTNELAESYRKNTSNPLRDRYEVALAAGVSMIKTEKGKASSEGVDGSFLSLADSLHAEFGDSPEGLELYSNIMRSSDVTAAKQVATKLVSENTLPAFARKEAQATVQRAAMLGKIPEYKLTTVDNKQLDLGVSSGRIRILCFWSLTASNAEKQKIVESQGVVASVNPLWIYVGFGPRGESTGEIKPDPSLKGEFCYYEEGLGGLIAAQYRVSETPYIFAFDADGKVCGYGPLGELGAIVEKAIH